MKILFTNKETKETKQLLLHTKNGTQCFKKTTKEVAITLAENCRDLIKATWGADVLLRGKI